MLRQKIFRTLMALAVIGGLAACADAGADEVNTPCDEVSAELEDARQAAEDAAGTPDESEANDLVNALENRQDVCESEGEDPGTTTSTTESTEECPDGHDVRLPDRTGGRLNADGVPEDLQDDPEGFREFILTQAEHDPLTLFHYYQASPWGKRQPLPNAYVLVDEEQIVEGNCYSEEGVEAFSRWAPLWETTTIVAVPQITFTGHNTGVTNDQEPTHSEGVTGEDQSGFDVTYQDGTGEKTAEHSALNRCTQPTGNDVPPNIPEGPTDNPPPKEGKDHTESTVSDDPNDPDERVRPNIDPAPDTVIRPPGSQPTQPSPPTTIADPPEVSDPEPIDPDTDTDDPTDDDPVDDGPCGDHDGDGIPDDC